MKLATRYECFYADQSGCPRPTRGDGKPPAKCRGCGGKLFVQQGLWGAFRWTEKNRYPMEDAVKIFSNHKQAETFAEANDLVVRWISVAI